MDQRLFWAIAVVLTGVVCLMLVQALRRAAPLTADDPDLKVYRDQLAEVDRDLARGTLAEDEAQRLRVEVSRRLLDADRALQAGKRVAPKGSLYWAAAAVAAVLAGSLWLYGRIGAPGYADLPLGLRLEMAAEAYAARPSQGVAEKDAPAQPLTQPAPEFLALMEKLRAAVTARPDDAMGLELLARNEAALGNFAAAAHAQNQLLVVLGPKATPQQHLMAAQIMVAAAGGYVSPEAEAELAKALQQDPQNGMGRYLLGLMFAQTGRPDRAFDLWQPLVESGPADAAFMAPILADIEQVASDAGIKYTAPGLKGPSAEDMAAASDMSAEDRNAMIAGMVDQLESRLMDSGGSADEWLRLINAMGVLNQPERGKAALLAAEAALAADPTALAAVRAAGVAAGIAP